MSRSERESGLSGLLFGEEWQTAAWRAAAVFILAYVLPTVLMLPTSRAAAFLKLLGTVLTFVLTVGAVYQFLQSRSAQEWSQADEELVEAPAPATATAKSVARVDEASLARPVATLAGTEIPRSLAARASPATLGQIALERLCITLYEFNGLRSQTVATGAAGEYRIRLVPRNAEKAIAILQCAAGEQEQGVEAYAKLLRVMEEEGLGKAFFIAPAGFAAAVVAQARARHVTLVDLKLLHAMIERLPESAREAVFDAAG